jgi:DNA-binding CsgD family transcriptional regulator
MMLLVDILWPSIRTTSSMGGRWERRLAVAPPQRGQIRPPFPGHIQTEREREMFRLRAVEGLTLDEIAERMGLHKSRVDQLLACTFVYEECRQPRKHANVEYLLGAADRDRGTQRHRAEPSACLASGRLLKRAVGAGLLC